VSGGASHICVFNGRRVDMSAPETVSGFVVDARAPGGRRAVTGALEKAAPIPRCDGTAVNGGQCRKRAVGGVIFAWGAVSLCAKHMAEEGLARPEDR
jgi:hypothetical protein